MSNIKVYTQAPPGDDGRVPVAGTLVYVGDTQLERVTSVQVVGELAPDLWQLVLTVFVDPTQCFQRIPKPEKP